MLRVLTAGESHGPGLIAILDGVPAGVRVTTDAVAAELARRRLGYGRGARMSLEKDACRIMAGVRHGLTMGSPVAIEVANSEWESWSGVMSPDPVDEAALEGLARNEALTRPRPGHADLAGIQKYGFEDARPVLERASARSTAARVAAGAVAKGFLAQVLGITVLSHVVQMGAVGYDRGDLPRLSDLPRIDADPLRCADAAASARMVEAVEATKKAGDTIGGVVEVVAWGCPPGLGSCAEPDRRLDARLAGALMGIQAIKGVEVGAGFAMAALPGSRAHDELVPGNGGIQRLGDNAGGIEGGMSNGSPIWVRAAMKPIATVPHALRTVDIATGEVATAHHQRSDITAVPAAGVVAEAEVAIVLADAVLEKFGGDSLTETKRNALAYLAQVRDRGLAIANPTLAVL